MRASKGKWVRDPPTDTSESMLSPFCGAAHGVERKRKVTYSVWGMLIHWTKYGRSQNATLTYTDVLRCYGMTMFVDVRLTSHTESVRTLPSEMSNRLGLLCN